MNRGRNRELIFLDDDDALDFLDTAGDTVERFGIECHAYSPMPNHCALLDAPKEMKELVLRLHRKAEPWPKGIRLGDGWFL